MKFKKDIEKVSAKLNELGVTHYLPVMDFSKELETSEMTSKLVYEHFDKIDKSDAVLIVNPTGYFGNSVKIEIGYAKGVGKKIFFLEKTNEPELDCLADDFISAEQLHILV
jgi:hypothetical protein